MNLTRELEANLKGEYQFVVGVDEAGRGPLAGPVVAAGKQCYVFWDNFYTSDMCESV